MKTPVAIEAPFIAASMALNAAIPVQTDRTGSSVDTGLLESACMAPPVGPGSFVRKQFIAGSGQILEE
ncbi:ketol-acid reductoisomerase [Novosphingobium sp. PY1]|nr:ketol-acid reductoisomerase [Novosphingobium sp. PY1]